MPFIRSYSFVADVVYGIFDDIDIILSKNLVFRHQEGTPVLQNTETRSTIDIDDDPSYSTESECEDSNSANEHNDKEEHLSI